MAKQYRVFWKCNECGRKHISNWRDNKEPPTTRCKRCGYTGQNRETVDYYYTKN